MEEGDRIAQIIFEKICTPEVQEVDVSTSHLYLFMGDVVNDNHLHDRTLERQIVERMDLDPPEVTAF